MLYANFKDDESHQPPMSSTRKSVKKIIVKTKQKPRKLAGSNLSLDLTNARMPISPMKTSQKPTILKDFINNQLVMKNKNVKRRAQDSETRFLDRMSARNSQHMQSWNTITNLAQQPSQKSLSKPKTTRGSSKKSLGTKKNSSRLSQVLQSEKKNGIVPYQGKASVKAKKVSKNCSPTKVQIDLPIKAQTERKMVSPMKKKVKKKGSKSPGSKKKKTPKEGVKSRTQRANMNNQIQIEIDLDNRDLMLENIPFDVNDESDVMQGRDYYYTQDQAFELKSELTSAMPMFTPAQETDAPQVVSAQAESPKTRGSLQKSIRSAIVPHSPRRKNSQIRSSGLRSPEMKHFARTEPPMMDDSRTYQQTSPVIVEDSNIAVNIVEQYPVEVTIDQQQDSMSSSNQEVEKIMTALAPENIATSAEPEPDPAIAKSPHPEESLIVRESYEYVNVEAYAIAKYAQKVLKSLPMTEEDEKSEAINQIVQRVNTAIDKLQYYQDQIKTENPKAIQAVYVCHSILLIEKYKLESQSFDLQTKIKQLLIILKHLSMKDQENDDMLQDVIFQEKQAIMFERIYHNHLFVLLDTNAGILDDQKVQKIFKIIHFLVAGKQSKHNVDDIDLKCNTGRGFLFNTTINVQEDEQKVIRKIRDSQAQQD